MCPAGCARAGKVRIRTMSLTVDEEAGGRNPWVSTCVCYQGMHTMEAPYSIAMGIFDNDL